MPPIYLFEIKKHDIFLRNDGQSVNISKKNCKKKICTLCSTEHGLQKYCKKNFANFLQIFFWTDHHFGENYDAF